MKSPTNAKEDSSLALGGQALIEGVMMRSRTHLVMCVRQPNNEILSKIEEINSVSNKYQVLRLPFIRGIIALFETFYLGVKSIFFSANAVLEEDEKFTYTELAVAVAVVLMLASLFFVTPFFLTSVLNLTGVSFNIIEAIVRLAIFLLYLVLVARWSEFHRTLQYHGAEHKTINAYEAGESLKIDNVRRFPRMHPRCGTSFLFIVVIISIILFSVMPDLGFAARLAYRVLLIPVIGAISYELLKLTGKYRESTITRILTMPGLAVQRLTTREPEDDMIEVAIAALENLNRLRD